MSSKRFLQALPPSARFLFLLLIVIGCASVFAFIGAMILYGITGLNLMGGDLSVLETLPPPEEAFAKKLLLSVQAIGWFVLPPIIYTHYLTDRKWTLLRLNVLPKKWLWLGGLVAIVAVQPLVSVVAELNLMMDLSWIYDGFQDSLQNMETTATANQELFLQSNGWLGLLTNIFLVALIPAIGEELLFRGVVQSLASRITKNAHLGIWLTALIFSAWHGQFFTFLPRFFLGALLGYLLFWSGSLWLPVLVHFLNNALAVLGHFLVQKGVVSKNLIAPESIETNLIAGGVGAVVLGLILYRMWQQRQDFPTYPEEGVVLPE